MSFICIAVVLCLVPDLSSAEFTVVPMTLNVTAGEPAVFTCRHSSTNFIAWTVNGVSAQSTNVTMSGVSVAGDTLTILALPENNGTVVECVAFFLDGSPPASTPPVVLIVQGNCNSTVAIAFIEEPQSQNVAIGETAQFRCRHPTADYIGWTLNGSSTINNTNNVSTKTVSLPGHDHGGRPRYILLIGAIPTYQGTIVICVARFINNCDSQDSAPAVLLIQGPLEAVSNIIRGLISDRTFSWNPPRSLDLTNVEPDVAYYVTIHNITCGKNDLLVEDHTVLDTYFMSSTIIPDSVYRIKVVPRSNVENAVNGTPLILEEEFIDYQVSQIHFIINPGANNLTATIEFTPNMTVPGHRIIPGKYKVIMTTNDGQGTYTVEPSISGTPSTVGLNLTFFLPTRRLWKYVLLAHNCRQHSLGSGTISTHDLQISTTTPQPGQIEVTGEFIDQSRAKGVLIIVYSFSNKSDSDIRYISPQPKTQLIHALVTNLNYSQYGVSVFIVEENGLPFSRVASIPEEIKFKSLTKEPNQPSHINIKYSLQSTSTGVCITCTFLDSSATDCVAVVHQRISQLSSSGLMNIESSHKLTRSGDTASGCIEGVNMEDYQVGVVGGRRLSLPLTETEDHSSSVKGVIVGIVLGVLVFILLAVAVVVVALIVVRKRKITKLLSRIVDIETSGPPITPSSDDVNQPGNEATVNLYESIPVTNRQESRAELNESADGALEPLLSTPSPPLPTRQGENRVYSDSSSDSATSSENTIETVLSSPSQSSDDRILGDPGPLYDQPQPPGSTDMQPPTDLQHQSNEEESPPPVPLRTEDRNVLVEQSSDPSLSVQDKTSTDIQSPPDPMYAEPQLPGRAPVQTSSSEEQALQSPPPVPPITEDREVLLQGSSGSSPNQGSPHIAVSIDQPPCPDPTYDKPQSPAVNQPPSKEKQQVSRIPSSETCGPTYAQPVLSTSSPTPSLPPVTEPVVYKDVKGFKNAEGQHYAILKEIHVAKSKETCRPDDRDQKPSVYVEIQPHSRGPTTAGVCVKQNQSSDKNTATPETHTKPPFTVENILPALLFMASKWQAVGKALSLDEDLLDEIFTNNETDEACLNVMLEHYMMRSDLKHSWEEIREAMRKVEEKDRETEELEPTSQRSPVKKHLDAGVGLDKCGEMMANELGDVPSTCSTGISHHHQIHYSKPSACESTTKSASSLEYSSKDGKGLTQGYQPNKNDKVSLNMEGLMEFQENCIQDIQGQSSADVLEQQTIKEHTKALDSDVNGNATRSPMSSPGKHEGSQEEINKNESSEGIRPEGPYRTRMDELFPTQLDDSLPCVSSLQPHLNVFPGIKKDQAKKSSQPTDCSVLSDDFDHLSGEQWIVTSLPTSQYHSLETCLISGNKSHAPVLHYSTPCQESSEDKTNYLAAIAKQLNIGRTPFARERKESEHGLFHLRRIPKPCANRKQLRVHKTVCTSSPSDSSQCTFVLTCTDTDTTRHQVCPFQDAGANVTLVNRNSDTMHLFLVHVNEYSRQYNQKSRYLQIYVRYIHIQDTEDRTQIICCEDVYKIILNVNLNLKVTTRVLHVVSYFCNVSYYFYCTTVSFIVSVLYSFLSLSVWVSLINYMYHSFYVNFLVSN